MIPAGITSPLAFIREPETIAAVKSAPDDGKNVARNMFSSV
jgi:hypothetical protein